LRAPIHKQNAQDISICFIGVIELRGQDLNL
jgi:hypothetical protein